LEAVLERGIDRYVNDQLEPRGDSALESRLAPLGATLRLSTSQVLQTYADSGNRQSSIQDYLDNFQTAKLIRAVHSANQLEEVLTDFWFNHFNVNLNDAFVRFSIQSYERDAIRPNVLGRFETLLEATASHPAMLYYLDNYLSVAARTTDGRVTQGINENYGRELLELHTVGVDAGYTQLDVYDAARAFTGWGIDNLNRGGNFSYRSANHDSGFKNPFGLEIEPGGQMDDGQRLIRYLAVHPSTARFVSTKLARRFVADEPPASLIDRMAETWLASGGDLKAVMKAMLGSPEFWTEALAPSGKPKTPFEYAVSTVRAFGGEITGGSRGLLAYISQMGQPLYQCIPPTGYADRGDEWLNPSSQIARMNLAIDLVQGLVNGVTVNVRNFAVGADLLSPASVARAANEAVFGGLLSADTLAAAGRVDTRINNPSAAVRASAILLASPDTQAR